MSSIDCSNAFNNNPDISGVGVRISFYLQTFLLVILVDRSWQDAPSALYTLIATSGGLQIAAVVQAVSGELSFLQALQVSNLVWLANFGTFVALASYSRHKAATKIQKASKKRATVRDYHVKYAAMAQTLVSMALTLYMWITAYSFGPQAECSNHLLYTFFAIKAPALRSGRIAGIVISTILTAMYIAVTAHEIKSSYRRRYQESDSPVKPTIPLQPSSCSSSVSTKSPRITTRVAPPIDISTAELGMHGKPDVVRRRPKRRRWSTDLDPMLVGLMICYILVYTYFIVSTELLIVYNPPDDDAVKEWAFGQILALIVVIPSALSVVNALLEHGVKRLARRKRITGGRNPKQNGTRHLPV